MVFHPSRYLDVPNVDVVSWTFSGPTYDQDKYIYIDAFDHTRRLTARQAQGHVRKLVYGLKHQGVKHGDIILIHSFSDIIYPILYLGIVGAGASFIGTNPSNTPDELSHIFSFASPRYILTSSRQLPAVLLAISTMPVPISTSNIFILNTPYDSSVPVGFQSWEILLRYGESTWERFNDEKTSNETIASLFLTSGTTGLPKVAAVSHRGSIARCLASSDPDPKPYSVSRLLCLPLFHGVAATASHIEPLRYGIPTYIMTRFSLSPFLCTIQEHHITETSVVPAIVSMILQGTEGQDEDTKVKLNSLRLVRCAGAPLDMAVQTAFQRLLDSDVRLVRAWGLTEFGTVTSFFHREADDTGSCGRLLANVEAIIVDPSGNEIIEEGVQGEILVRGPSVMSQYMGNDEATKEAFVNGWLRTGDIGYCQEKKWHIVGRLKDMIKVRGWQVAPAELEACLLKHDLVADVAVIGVKSTTQESELPRAYVVLKQAFKAAAASTTIEEELKGFLGSRLAKYKALDGGVRIVESLPKTASGKTAKRILREGALREAAADGQMDM